ncbi:MAG: hypothetical protein NZ954_04340 [Thermofilaceae archaeon]|nr:hypothetical protein [Thermofilaceae archaeon]MCX8180028.1 hypothetical protein [Thermofilaceae archaeon]MDW8003229.1 hypothetical protein [Thermofilaceae archaeon]
MVTLKKRLAFLLVLTILAQPVFSQYEYDGVRVSLSNDGVIIFEHEAFTKSTGRFKTWGPAWSWEDACSLQDNWVSLHADAGDVEASFEGSFTCSFAQVSWREQAWFGVDSILLELTLSADKDSNFSGLAWDLDLPISLFAGQTVSIILMNKSIKTVKLRETHVPGTWVIEGSQYSNGIGWVVPYTSETGLVLAVFGEAWPGGMSIHVEDNRQWGGTAYSLRNWLFFDLALPPGVLVKLYVYIRVYKSLEEVEAGIQLINELSEMIQRGVSGDSVKSYLIDQLNLEEAAAIRRARGPPTMLLAYAGIAVVATIVVVYSLTRKRK